MTIEGKEVETAWWWAALFNFCGELIASLAVFMLYMLLVEFLARWI